MKRLLLMLFSVFTMVMPAQADSKPKLVTIFSGKEMVAGLVNMDVILNEPGSGCSQFTGVIKIEGVQFSESGTVLQSFRFTDKNQNQWSVPTNIESLSNVDRSLANSFVKVGKSYFAHVQVCGSGGFSSLINLYNANLRFGPN